MVVRMLPCALRKSWDGAEIAERDADGAYKRAAQRECERTTILGDIKGVTHGYAPVFIAAGPRRFVRKQSW